MSFSLLLTHLILALTPAPGRRRDERGDIPGWVMVTVLTVGMALVIFTFAEDQLTRMLKSALNRVK